jgi:hypothetical protein
MSEQRALRDLSVTDDDGQPDAPEACGSGTACDLPLDDPDITVVLRGALADLQRAADRLEAHGVEAAIVRGGGEDPAGCCTTSLYLAVAREDAAAAFAVFDQEWRRGLSPEQIAALDAAAHIVLDPDAAETTCPACLTTFATGPSQCPDCGLTIG